MSRRALWGLVLAAAAAGCGGEDTKDPAGGGGGGAGDIEAGCLQAPTCVESLRKAPLSKICVQDACLDVGARDGGAVVTSDMIVYSRYPGTGAGYTIKSYALTVLHPTRPDGGTLDCGSLLALAPEKRRNAGYTNVLEWATGRVENVEGSDTFPAPASAIPVNEPGVKYLVLAELWSGLPDSTTGVNGGTVVGEGCLDDFVAVPGPMLNDDGTVNEDHAVALDMRMYSLSP